MGQLEVGTKPQKDPKGFNFVFWWVCHFYKVIILKKTKKLKRYQMLKLFDARETGRTKKVLVEEQKTKNEQQQRKREKTT